MLPNIWPLFNLINIIQLESKKDDSAKSVNQTNSYQWHYELIVRHLRLSTYLVIASSVYYFTFPSYEQLLQYNSITESKEKLTWWLQWALIIFVRDQCITYFFYAGWHWVLYQSRWATKMKTLKFNPAYPDDTQWRHDRFWTLNGAAIATLFELFMIWYYIHCGVAVVLYSRFEPFSVVHVLWLLFIPYWRDFHFYWIHRVMHKWNWKLFGLCDVGEYLYKHVHSLHHKSYNTGPWSGLSMHPVEHLIYYSCMLVPSVLPFCVVKQHPIHMLFNKFHAHISPLPGHDGFDSPGGGSYFHYLHHAHFECNYGTPMVPFDKLFGSFEDGSKYRRMKKFDSVKENKQQ